MKRAIRKIEVVLMNKSLQSFSNGEHWLAKQLPDSPVVLDIGFYQGEFTLETLEMRPSARVHAFDPSRQALREFEARFEGEPRASFTNMALSDHDGKAVFHDYGNMCGSLSARPDAGDEVDDYEVPVRRLDSWCREQSIEHIDMVKIDAEGYDFPVIKGAQGLLDDQAIDVLQFEYADGWISSRYFLRDVVDFFADKPYGIFQLFNPALFTKDVNGVGIIGRPTWLALDGGFTLVRDGQRATAPSPRSFFVAMGAASSEALRQDGRDPVAA